MRIVSVLLGLGLSCPALADTGSAGGPGGLFPYLDAKAVERGQGLYADNCAACHGDALEGQPDWRTRLDTGRMPAPPHGASGHTWHHPDTLLFMITKYGTSAVVGGGYESDMAAFGDMLSDAEIVDILAFIKSTWPERIQLRHNELNAANADR